LGSRRAHLRLTAARIFQKNVAATFDEIAVAWNVTENLGHGWSHKFDYPL